MTFFTETVGITVTRVQRYFNAANQLIDSFDYVAGTTSFYYDNNGNLVEQLLPGSPTQHLHYQYNQRNLLVASQKQTGTGPLSPVVAYWYDGANNRLAQTDYTPAGPAGTSYTNDVLGLSQVLVSDGEAGQFYNLFGLDLISQQTLSQTRTLLPDGLGSVRTEMVGSAIHTLTTYEPFGKVLAQTGSSGTTYGFTGEQFDSTTNLQYLRARYYSPSLKIFLSRDPFPGSAVLSQSQHSYAYVHNNPVNLADPSGSCVFFGIDTLICLGAGIGFISSYAIQTIVNMTNGMDLLEAIYHENIDETQVVASTAAGGISGALTPLIPAGATWAGVLGYGALDGPLMAFWSNFSSISFFAAIGTKES